MGKTMVDHLSLGKNGNIGNIDLGRIKGGIKKEGLVQNDLSLGSVFDLVDKNKDGVLDREELDGLQQTLSNLAGKDGNLEKKEIKNFDGQKLGRQDRKALLKFLNKLAAITPENVKKVETKLVDDTQVEVVIFKDGHIEEYYPNGQKISEVVSGNKKIKTTEMNGAVTSEVVTDNEGEENEIISTTTTLHGQKQTVINNKGDKTITTINYNGDKKTDSTIVGENSTSVITYDSEGNPAKEVETSGITEKTYLYQNDKKVLQSVIENKGLEGKETTKVYDSEGGYTQTKEVGNGKIITVVDKDGNVTSNVKKEKINDQDANLQLDKDGNIPGVIIQNGESPVAIAKKFGCSVDELLQLNADQLKGKGKNQYFVVGSEIKLPGSVSIEKFNKVSKGRKPAEIVKQEYARNAEIRRQKAEVARQEREYYQKLGVKNFNNKGQKVKADGWGKKEFEVIGDVGYGRKLVNRDGKLYTRSHDGKILREDYLQAHKYYVSKPKNQRNNTASGLKDVTYVKDNNGKVWYFDEKTGKAIVKGNYTQIVKQESAFVANQLYKAAKNDDAWYNALGTGVGTDNELFEKGINNIYSADILAGVNTELRTKDRVYDVDVNKAQMMPVEALILDENNHKSARPLLKTLINSGAMTVQEQARTIKREMEYELAGESGGVLTQSKRALEHFEFGTSYTSTSDLNEIMQMTSNREVRLEIENQYKNDSQFAGLEPNEGSYVRARIGTDGGLMHWNAQEVDQFDANWVKTGAYQEARYVKQTDENGVEVLDANGQPVYVLDEGDQEHRNGVIGRLVFDYQDKEALNKGLDAVNENSNSFDYRYLDHRASEEIAKDPQGKYQSRFTNQDNIQRYLAGFHSDAVGNIDSENVSASNTYLFKGVKPVRVQAEEALYNAKNGDYSQTFDSMDADTYSAMSEIIASGDIKGVKNMTDLYNKAYNSVTDPNDKTKIKANAILSGQLKDNFSDEQIANFCVELMHTIDANRGRGGSTGMSAGYTNNADYQTEQLKAILQNNPQVMNAVETRVEKEAFSYTTMTQAGGGVGQQLTVTNHTTNTKDKYMQLIAETKAIANDEIFYDANGIKITDSKEIEKIKSANMQSLQQMRQYVAELERDFKKGVDAEGTLSDAGNAVLKYSGLGTDREDVATEYRQAKLMLQQFEAAAQGKLRDRSGKVISAQDLATQMLDKQNALVKANSDYKQSVTYAKMGIVMAPVIVATTVASGGAAAAGWGTFGVTAAGGAAAGATTYSVNALEYNTSHTGNTAEAREQNLQDSLVNGVTTAVGIGQMKYIGNMANNMGTAARTGIRLTTTVAADTAVGAAAEGLTTKDLSASGFLSNMGMSLVGNAIGAKSLGKKQPAPNMHPRDGVYLTQDAPITGRNEIADAGVARNIDQSHLNGHERKMIAREMEAQGTPTPKELDVYAKEHASHAPTAEEGAALDVHHEHVSADYSEAHRIENNATIKEQKVKAAELDTAEKTFEVKIDDEIPVIDVDGVASTSPANNSKVNIYKLKSNPNATLREYTYTLKSGQTFKFMAAEGLDAKNFQFLARIDLSKRIISSKISNFSEFSDATQFKFAKLYSSSDKARQSELFELLLSLHRDEKKLFNIISNTDLLDKRLADIKELKTYFSNTVDFQYLDGLLDIKNSDAVKFERLKSSGILDLVKEGHIQAQSLGQLGIHSDLSPELYSDLALLKSGKSIVPEFVAGTDLRTAFEQTKLGDAVEVGNKMYLNNGSNLVEWNMTKKKYLELFPPVQRFATTQGAINDCYLIQTLGLSMHNPKARVEFLQSFSLKGDDVVVTVKGLEDYHGSKMFEGGNINLGSKHCIGCKGIQMYEQTYAAVALRASSPVDYPNIAPVDDIMQRVNGGQAAQTMADVFGKGHIADILPKKIRYSLDDPTIHHSTSYSNISYDLIPYKKGGKTLGINLNLQKLSNTKIHVLDKFFVDYPNKSLALSGLDISTTETLLTHMANNDNYLISFGTSPKKGAATESSLLAEYNIVSSHAYSILGYNEGTKMVKIGNPHAYGEVTEIPLETLHQYIRHLDILKL